MTSSAVTGSSAITSFGLERQREGDGGALAHAARELVRVIVEPLRIEPDHLEQLARRRSPRRASRPPRCQHFLDCAPTR